MQLKQINDLKENEEKAAPVPQAKESEPKEEKGMDLNVQLFKNVVNLKMEGIEIFLLSIN